MLPDGESGAGGVPAVPIPEPRGAPHVSVISHKFSLSCLISAKHAFTFVTNACLPSGNHAICCQNFVYINHSLVKRPPCRSASAMAHEPSSGQAVGSTGRPSSILGVLFLICEHFTMLLTIKSSYRTFFSENFRWCTEFVNMQIELF
jgi:hypothetical protein